MSSKYARQRDSAYKTLKKKGTLLTFKKEGSIIVDPVTDKEIAGDAEEASGYGVVLPPTTMTEQTYQQQFMAGTLKLTEVQRILLSPVGMEFIPEEGHTVWIKADNWTVLGGKTLDPDNSGEPILLEYTIKK